MQPLAGGGRRPAARPETAKSILEANDEYARGALRVLALARRQLPPRVGAYTIEEVEHDLTFLGLVAMMDPPRPEVTGAIDRCREGGIRMVMITGDYGLTAESVARRIGMLSPGQPRILTGAELDRMTDVQLRQTIGADEVVFARMAPEHKLRLVTAFQELGEVVAVIGDGVNDAPALRKADIGIAMGRIGTDVAKEAADLVLTNDDFSGIATALEEGRAVFDNLRKFSTYIFASNVPQLIPFVLAAAVRFPAGADRGPNPGHRPGDRHPAGAGAGRRAARAERHAPAASQAERAAAGYPSLPAGIPVAGHDRGRRCAGGPSHWCIFAFGLGVAVGLPAWPWLVATNPLLAVGVGCPPAGEQRILRRRRDGAGRECLRLPDRA